jgi:HD superfamily phosphohydrolase
MKKIIGISVLMVFIYGCLTSQYIIGEQREGAYKFDVFSGKTYGEITLPGNPNNWKYIGRQGDLHTFQDTSTGEFVQYCNTLKNEFDFYTTEVNTNEKFFDAYFKWLKQKTSNLETVDSMKIIFQEINEDEEDYIIVEINKKSGWNNYICASVRQNLFVGANIITNDERKKALERLDVIYKGTKIPKPNP